MQMRQVGGQESLNSFIILSTLLMASCATQGVNTFSSTPAIPSPVSNEIQVAQPYSKIWDKLVRQLSKSFFVINNIDKESRIINLSFTTNSPVDYVDCGRSHRTYTVGKTVQTYDYEVAGPAAYRVAAAKQEHPAFSNYAEITRAPSLEGRTNVYLAPSPNDANSTTVTVNTRYILSMNVRGHAYAEHMSGNVFDRGVVPIDPFVISFNTNAPTTEKTGNETLTCSAKGKLEREILGMVTN